MKNDCDGVVRPGHRGGDCPPFLSCRCSGWLVGDWWFHHLLKLFRLFPIRVWLFCRLVDTHTRYQNKAVLESGVHSNLVAIICAGTHFDL